ncbi:MAG: class II aldolase/adducin family protein [Corynebacterium sp.]|nr:class II aldolase/adducin family protein [Corynebacterium sp.]
MAVNDFHSARSAVIDTAHALVEEGLVVRTWGNVSHRTEGDGFVITPSGRSYDTMIEADLARFNQIGDWSGPFKPSGEWPMHRLCYQLRPHVNTVIHTHQPYASALSIYTGATPHLPWPRAVYGLPGTKRLHAGVRAVLDNNPDDDTVLLTAHGVFICAEDDETALARALAVEQQARELYIQIVGSTPDPGVDEEPSEEVWDEITHHRSDVGAALICRDSEVAAFYGLTLNPYVDDFAQIVGVRANSSYTNNVVLTGDYAVCMGANLEEAKAVRSVLTKNARAARVGQACGAKPLAVWDRLLQNTVYRLSYSKQQ